MITRYSLDDAYTYADSPVLKNKANHTTQEALDKFERLSTALRQIQDLPEGGFDYPHLKALHRHLFQDVYDWAGEERNIPISKGSTPFANPRCIHGCVTALLAQLARENHLQGLAPEDFAKRAAHYMLELNMLHPFREGNGRTCRSFLSLLAQNAGFDIDMTQLRAGWLDACIEGVNGSEEPMQDVIVRALVVLEG
ncbi:cell filamentation protein [Desulfobaculum xiamenense]|uniref:protein adenylyltransferase n=1 Tax=Desulfobaculum xiamenense TaxID=995050 RepID=A0A846QLW1_9BACT|nr:Fic family protein [Desulfobaculum xiamenense]NJB66425.1 cell filamentation protein [Desulfobaculum xiamenense]